MPVLLAIVLLIQVAHPVEVYGGLAYYSPSVMERVVTKRINQGYFTREYANTFECYAASLYNEEIGTTIDVSRGDLSLTCLVVDVAQKRHKQSIRNKGIVIEVDYGTGYRYGCINKRPRDCKVVITINR